MNVADLALGAVVLISCLVGLWRGFVVEVMSLLVWIAAFLFALMFGGEVASGLQTLFESPLLRAAIAYLGLFLLTLMVGGLVTWLLGKLIESTGLSGTDRLLGLGFGLVRGVAMTCVLILLLGFTGFPQEAWWRESRLIVALQPAAAWLGTFLPEAARAHLKLGGAADAGIDVVDARRHAQV